MKKIVPLVICLCTAIIFNTAADEEASGEAAVQTDVSAQTESAAAALPADGTDQEQAPPVVSAVGTDPGNPAQEGPELLPTKKRPFIVFQEGVTAAWLTRIIKQSGRSNFVFKDFMPGLYFSMKTVNMQPLNSMLRLSLYYPLSFKFNEVPQYQKNFLRYAIDVFAGITFELPMWNIARINLSPGLHLLYQTSDRWNYFHVGAAGSAGLELPISRRWTILLNGIASIDYGNFGNNADMEPLDIVYQYQLDVGVRYSKRKPNPYPYIKGREAGS